MINTETLKEEEDVNMKNKDRRMMGMCKERGKI